MRFPTFPVLAVLAVLGLLGGIGRASSTSEWTVERADAAGLTLLWENRALGASGETAPRATTVGIPPGAKPVVSLEILEEKSAAGGPGSPGVPPSGIAALRNAANADRLVLSKPARYRDLDMSSLSLEPSANGRILARARVRVDFRASAASRKSFAPLPEAASERHLKSWIANYAQSRDFRQAASSRPLAKAGAAPATTGPTAGAALPRTRLVIKTRGENIQVVDFAALKKAGLPLGSIDPRQMRLWQGGTEVPMFIAGGDDGRWDPRDHIEFIGKEPRGDRTYRSLFVSTSTFLLTWDGGRLGLRAPAVPVSARDRGPLALGGQGIEEAPPYKAQVHMEEDREILRIGSTAQDEIVDLGARVQETDLTDFWMWQRIGAEIDSKPFDFTLDYDPVAQGQGGALKVVPLKMRITLKGITNHPKADPDHHVKFILNGKDISLVGGVANDAIWEGQESHTWISRDLDPGVLKPGKNTLVIQKVNDLKANDGTPVEIQDAYLNWFELEFPSGYRAQGDLIRFSNDFEDSLGVRAFTLSGFTKPDLSVWDLGGRKLTGYRLARLGGGYDITLVDSLAGPTRYLACVLDKREVPVLALDTLPDLVAPSEGADYLVLTHRDLLGSALDSLLAHRRKQGLRAKVVQATHIYQAFGDGSLDPASIRRFVEHAYREWPRPAPAYLLLLGETSLWYEKSGGEFQKTLVPTQLVNVHGWGVAAHDDYFVRVSGDDPVADLFVGRIPVATREDLSKVVRKTLALETKRPAGHWANKALLVAGFEETFTLQNSRLQSLSASLDRNVSRLDLYPRSPHYKSAAQRTGFFDQLDSAFSLVSFVGHGGGAVWSDAGVLTLRHLDEGKLKGDFPIPFISSITCLTGYFEDVAARSLGEELIRLDKSGAAAFYGAAGYISNLAGEALSYEVLAAAAAGGAGAGGGVTAGSIVHRAETMVHLKTAGAFTPILAEFNLLGDPALVVPFPDREGDLTINPATLSGGASLEAQGRNLKPDKADGVLTVLVGDSAIGTWNGTVSGGGFDLKQNLPGFPSPVPDGKAILHYWSTSGSKIATAPFSTLDWLVDQVSLDPSGAAPGDSVTVKLRLRTAYKDIAVDGGIAFFALGGDTPPQFPPDNQSVLRSVDPTRLETASRIQIPLPGPDLTKPTLYVAFRVNARVLDAEGQTVRSIPNLNSRAYSLPVSDLARLSFAEPAFRVPVQEEAGAWTAFRNTGLGVAEGFEVELTTDAEGAAPGTVRKTYSGKLGLGGLDSLFFPLADSLFQGKRLRASLKPKRDGELSDRGTVRDTVFRILTRKVQSGPDTLRLDSSTLLVLPSGSESRRAFAEKVSVTSLANHLKPAAGGLPAPAWRIRLSLLDKGLLTLSSHEPAPASPKVAAATPSAADRPFWHFQEEASASALSAWLKLDTVTTGHPWTASTWKNGLYGLYLNSDVSPPLIQFSSRGQALLQDDYVPQNTPINVVVRDVEGVDLSFRNPSVLSTRQDMDSTSLASEASAAFPTLVRFNFIPRHKDATDSLIVTAADVSGNRAVKTLAYRHGEDLTIRNLGSYPNPFADTAVFAYSLTDYCERVELKIFSRAGRHVRTLEERNVVGYREVVWDGRAQGGARIGNGLYFLKVTAKAGDQEASKVFKLFKKRRK